MFVSCDVYFLHFLCVQFSPLPLSASNQSQYISFVSLCSPVLSRLPTPGLLYHCLPLPHQHQSISLLGSQLLHLTCRLLLCFRTLFGSPLYPSKSSLLSSFICCHTSIFGSCKSSLLESLWMTAVLELSFTNHNSMVVSDCSENCQKVCSASKRTVNTSNKLVKVQQDTKKRKNL